MLVFRVLHARRVRRKAEGFRRHVSQPCRDVICKHPRPSIRSKGANSGHASYPFRFHPRAACVDKRGKKVTHIRMTRVYTSRRPKRQRQLQLCTILEYMDWDSRHGAIRISIRQRARRRGAAGCSRLRRPLKHWQHLLHIHPHAHSFGRKCQRRRGTHACHIRATCCALKSGSKLEICSSAEESVLRHTTVRCLRT